MPCYSPLKGWRNGETGAWQSRAEGADMEMEVACGSCLGCRLDRSRMWAIRIVHEASLYKYSTGNCFITLTYRDLIEASKEEREKGYYIPDDWSLNKQHFIKFMKRLRKHFKNAKIRYFMCGEYGNTCKHGLDLSEVSCEFCNFGRPHYHAIIFNHVFLDIEKYTQQNGEDRFTSPELAKLWPYGFNDVGEVNFESAAYVARYLLKKKDGVKFDDWYVDYETGVLRQKEYCTMSRGGTKGSRGLAYEWYEKYKDDVFPRDEVPVSGGFVSKSVPRYYEDLFANENPLSLEEIKEIRKKFREEHADEYTPERLMAKYKVKKAQIELLKRTVS